MTSCGTISGRPATATSVNGLYAVSGSHSYARRGRYVGTVTVTAPGVAPTSARFVVVVAK